MVSRPVVAAKDSSARQESAEAAVPLSGQVWTWMLNLRV